MKTLLTEALGALIIFVLLRAAAGVVEWLADALSGSGPSFIVIILHYAATFTSWVAWIVFALALIGALVNFSQAKRGKQ